MGNKKLAELKWKYFREQKRKEVESFIECVYHVVIMLGIIFLMVLFCMIMMGFVLQPEIIKQQVSMTFHIITFTIITIIYLLAIWIGNNLEKAEKRVQAEVTKKLKGGKK